MAIDYSDVREFIESLIAEKETAEKDRDKWQGRAEDFESELELANEEIKGYEKKINELMEEKS
jgi:chromosome segregation ATPase